MLGERVWCAPIAALPVGPAPAHTCSQDARPHDCTSHRVRGAPSPTRRERTQTHRLVQGNTHNSLGRDPVHTRWHQRQAHSDTGSPMAPLPHPPLTRTHHSQGAQTGGGSGQASCRRPPRSPRAWPEPGIALADLRPFLPPQSLATAANGGLTREQGVPPRPSPALLARSPGPPP